MVTCFLFLFSSLCFISYRLSPLLFLYAFAELQKAAISFVMYAVCLHGTSRLPLGGFS